MKDHELMFVAEDIKHHATPEQLLWLAVIDRALVDYIKWDKKLPMKYKMGLNNFLFDEKPSPFNLAYLCEQLFSDSGAAAKIRKRAIAMAKGNVPAEELEAYKRERHGLRVKNS